MTTDKWRQDALWGALRMIGEAEPKDLIKRAQPDAEDRGESLDASDFARILGEAEASNAFLAALGLHVHRWDIAAVSDQWTEGTAPSTSERRDLVCRKLGLDQAGAAALLVQRPIYHDSTIVITAPWRHWYTPQRASEHEFYWPSYRRYLIDVKGWPLESVTSLDLASTQVIERLTEPTRPEAYQSKGLVVGYVQSGKTANITGVVAKAVDAGYRLIIVMTGTIELLRAQTQRRIDMELVGRENILGDLSPEQASEARIDYQDDQDWLAGNFVALGSPNPATEIRRLTTHRRDYQKQFKTLKIERFDSSRHLFDPRNLFPTAANLVVAKKNSTVLKKLVTDIRANKTAFAEIPVLIIDDESDLASVNTIDPEVVKAAKTEGKEVRERRAINERIADMLELMPRAQYVGYTATPFANVFADPSDPQGIFPKDYVIGLPRPLGYMGVEDFHDLTLDPDEPKTFASSNEMAFVRDLHAEEGDDEAQDRELSQAIDMFVLAGAIKLWRATNGGPQFRHHTMLVHHSVRKLQHKDMAERVKRLWSQANFSGPVGKNRLQSLYESDFVPVSAVRREEGVPALPLFDDLSDHVAKVIARVTEHNLNPVIVVNSDRDIQQQELDFDRQSTWRILVGGAKLSRGFTIEGLTTTYFRRATNMGDSLTQMGRWFGFRDGYQDLVRLFIARRARFGQKSVDLYEAFQSVALDETAFRQQLAKYAEWEDDKPKVLPRQIPPLVSQHLPWLMPTARNKMFNARILEQSEQPFTPAGYANHTDQLKENLNTWRPLLGAAGQPVELPIGKGSSLFDAYVGVVAATDMVDAIESTRYLYLYRERTVDPKISFYRRLIEDAALEDFLIVVPRPDTELLDIQGVGARSIISRDRRQGRGGKFGEMTDPKNRRIIERFVKGEVAGTALQTFATDTRGAALLYIARESNPNFENAPSPDQAQADLEHGLVIAFSIYVPEKALAKDPDVIRFVVIDETHEDSPIIDVRNSGGGTQA